MDHIDPSWAEGRDYQIVCGLDVVFNMAERDRSLNISKNNRFLPWRNIRDEMGGDPVEQGDLCLFLDPDTNNWVLEEFLGTWWYDKSTGTCGRANRVLSAEARAKISEAVRNRPPISDETRAKMSEAQRERTASAETKAKMSEAHKNRPPISDETRAKQSEAARNRPLVSDETRAKMSEASRGRTHSDESKAKMSEASRGRTHSDEAKAKISEIVRNRPPVSEETRAKMSEAGRRRHARNRLRRMAMSDPQCPDFED